MREIALHILDLIENSIRAQATVITVTVAALPAKDLLRIVIEDNGTGLKVAPEAVLNPFYTTKSGKRTGLGLSLFRGAAEATGGTLVIGKSDLGPVGVRVTVELGLSHVDRNPLGDLGATFSSVVCTNPHIDFRFQLRLGDRVCDLSSSALARELGIEPGDFKLAQVVLERTNAQLRSSDVLT